MIKPKRHLLLEVGTEEIPSGYIPHIISELKDNFISGAKKLRLTHGEVTSFATPRRIVLYVQELDERQISFQDEVLGPPERLAFAEDGTPTQAGIGFANTQSVSFKDLKIKETEKGRYVMVLRQVQGEKTEKILQSFLPDLIQSLHFPRSMRWGSTEFRFVRPIHWLVALYGQSVVPFELAGVKSGKKTLGHRFLAPGAISLRKPQDYFEKLRANYCFVDQRERAEFLKKQLQVISRRLNLTPVYTDSLLQSILNVVEYPFAVVGEMDRKYMSLPTAVLQNVLNEQLKFLTTLDKKGQMTEKFIAVANIKPESSRVLREGYERVVSARLADAHFFFQEDLKVPLKERVEKLRELIYFGSLGTYFDKTLRLQYVASAIAESVAQEHLETLTRAAFLCKADLLTNMVKEFPKLQGIMGREYTARQGEDKKVCLAIYEHYLPRFSGDELPTTVPGLILSIADKMDNIVAGFALNFVPTGTADPHGLRRQALGVLNSLLGSGFHLSLDWVCDIIIGSLKGALSFDAEKTKRAVMEFLRGRIESIFLSEGMIKETIDAILSVGAFDPLEIKERIVILREALQRPDINTLLLAYRRVVNILGESGFDNISEGGLIEPEEKNLYSCLKETETAFNSWMAKGSPSDAFNELMRMVGPINSFFDKVLVMSEDINLRNNRLALLKAVKNLFLSFADFSKLPIKTAGG